MWDHLFLQCRVAWHVARHYGFDWLLDIARASSVSFALFVASGPFALLTAKWLAVMNGGLRVPPASPAASARSLSLSCEPSLGLSSASA